MIILYTIEKSSNGTKFYGTIESNPIDILYGNSNWIKIVRKFVK